MNQTIPLSKAVHILQQGGVGILPTDTVYGLAVRAADRKAVARFYALKERGQTHTSDKNPDQNSNQTLSARVSDKPGTIIAANIDQLVDLGIKRRYLSAVAHYWPNPLSIVIPTGDTLSYLHLGKDSLAIRIPDNAALRSLLEKTGPLVTSSANHPGKPPATTIDEAYAYFGSEVDFYVDGGDLSGRPPSTVIRIVDDAIEVLREGAFKINENGRF